MLRRINPLLQCQRREFCTEDVHQNVAQRLASFGFLRSLHSRPFKGTKANFDEKESFIHHTMVLYLAVRTEALAIDRQDRT